MGKKITGTAHITIPMKTMQSLFGKTTTMQDWFRHPWTIRTAELHYKNERFFQVTIPPIDQELLEDIKKNGMTNPLLVIRAFNGKPYVWLGNQRLAIARELGMEWVSCVEVKTADDVIAAVEAYKK